MKIGFENFYLYSAIDYKTGEDFTLFMPDVNVVCMNVWLEQFNLHHIQNKEIILVMDGAGWHKSKNLVIPKNIQIVFLPAYSPELNPVERFWKFIKDNTIKNRIFANLESIARDLALFIRSLDRATVASVCKVEYLLN